jgi:hypothetical protein
MLLNKTFTINLHPLSKPEMSDKDKHNCYLDSFYKTKIETK